MEPTTRPFESPIRARFTPEYFDRIPKEPGIYWFTGTKSQTLFIGKSRNLRQHLLSYREINADRCSSYLFELLKQVSNIHWLTIKEELQLFAIEKQRLNKEKPHYNQPDPLSRESRIYIGLTWGSNSLNVGLHRELQELPYSELFGPFKKPVFSHKALTGLLRALWTAAFRQPPSQAPAPLMKVMSPAFQQIQLPIDGLRWKKPMSQFFRGESLKLITDLEKLFTGPMTDILDPFSKTCLKQDLDLARLFFRHGPEQNYQLNAIDPLPLDQIHGEWPNPLL